MNIIAHRGYWLKPSEKNTAVAFIRALKNNFGIETDFRDFKGELVISHDIPNSRVMKSSQLADLYRAYPVSAPMALNIKSDGLYNLIIKFLSDAEFKCAFVFDMSIPDMRGYLRYKIPIFARLSEYESPQPLFDSCSGVWLDSFEGDWYDADTIICLLNEGKKVAIVSPELHGRPYENLWMLVKKHNFHLNELVSICTDHPMQAKEYFYG